MAKPRQTNVDEFGIAESLGEIRTMPEINEKAIGPVAELPEVIDNPEDFRMAIGNAQMNGAEYVEVGEKLFKYLLKNSKSKYLTYGAPGIKVYKAGTREQYEREDKMTAEAFAEYEAKQKQMNANA
jgi:hypothetical protein